MIEAIKKSVESQYTKVVALCNAIYDRDQVAYDDKEYGKKRAEAIELVDKAKDDIEEHLLTSHLSPIPHRQFYQRARGEEERKTISIG